MKCASIFRSRVRVFRPHFGFRSAWMLVTFSIFYVLIIIYCRSAGYQDPSSIFFDVRRAYARRYSAYRAEQADAYINTASEINRRLSNTVEPPLLCMGIATVARRGNQYVRTTVGSLFVGLSQEQRDSIFFNLLIAHTDPAKHPVFAEQWLDMVPDQMLQYPKDAATVRQIQLWEDGGWYRNKSIHDYRYLLSDCYDTGAQYIAMIEDDTLAVEGWFQRLLDALEAVRLKMQAYPSDQRWIYLRLFYTDDLLGWNSEQWATYLFWSFSIWMSFTTMILMVKRRFPTKCEFITYDVVAILSIVCIPALILLFFLAGKQTMMPIPGGVQEMNEYGCCSQGFVYPRSMIPHVLDQLSIETKGLVDMQIEKIADAAGYVRWAIVPPLLQHIGGTSSKGYGFDDNAQQTWSFRYEQYSYG